MRVSSGAAIVALSALVLRFSVAAFVLLPEKRRIIGWHHAGTRSPTTPSLVAQHVSPITTTSELDTSSSSSSDDNNNNRQWQVLPDGLAGSRVWDERPKPHLTTSMNATLPIALMVLDPESYPTRSMAMRAIRYV
jgi:hypothetical protein